MEEFPPSPIFIKYEQDPIDETLYNSADGNNNTNDNIPFFSAQTSSLSQNILLKDRFKYKRKLKHTKEARTLLDGEGKYWTECQYRFYFHIYDEFRCNKLETILLENNYYHTILEPMIIYHKQLKDSRTMTTTMGHSICSSSTATLFYQHLNQHENISDSKPLRCDHREIVLDYSVYLCGIAKPLSNYYQLSTLSLSKKDEITLLNDLITTQLTDFQSFLTLLLMMSQELNTIHSEGLCHSQLTMTTFLLYSPSRARNKSSSSNQWGVQMMAHWLFLPCGPSNSCNSLHLPQSGTMLLSLQDDVYQLGKIFLEMTLSWITLRSQSHHNLGSDFVSKCSQISQECVAGNHCTVSFQDLLSTSLKELMVPSIVFSEFIQLLNGLLHADPWERYECFQIEVIIMNIIELLSASASCSPTSSSPSEEHE